MIAIIDYGVGNLGSIANMFKKIGIKSTITSDPSIICSAEKLVLPGVGAFDHCMLQLQRSGLIPLLNKCAKKLKKPILGICVGMQMMAKHSQEGIKEGLGWIDAEVVKFNFNKIDNKLKIPHMGWNTLEIKKSSPLFDVYDEYRFYFVHSYYLQCHDNDDILATTLYGNEFTSAILFRNIVGVQFHPEKSHKYGMQFFNNYAERS